jgi:hypothetical protein
VSRRILHSPTTEEDVIGIRFDTRLELADIDAFEIVGIEANCERSVYMD